MPSSAVRRRSSRTSVLGKRSHQSQFEAAPSPTSIKSPSHDLLDNDDDTFTIDSSPCAKRPRTSLTSSDRNGNKENIPPLIVDLRDEPSRALRRSSSEFVTPTRTRTSMRVLLFSMHTL